MFRKSILSAVTIATLAVATAATGTTSAFAGGYGYNGGGYSYNGGGHKNGGYAGKHGIPSHVWNKHVRWCGGRYNSYRAWDNSWLPYYNGHRKQCWSPFYRG
jgi:hypothetical protein